MKGEGEEGTYTLSNSWMVGRNFSWMSQTLRGGVNWLGL